MQLNHSGNRLSIQKPSYQHRNSHCKEKTVSRPSYLYYGNNHTFYIETDIPSELGQCIVYCLLASPAHLQYCADAGSTEPYLPQEGISATCAYPVSRNGRHSKAISMRHHKHPAERQVLIYFSHEIIIEIVDCDVPPSWFGESGVNLYKFSFVADEVWLISQMKSVRSQSTNLIRPKWLND